MRSLRSGGRTAGRALPAVLAALALLSAPTPGARAQGALSAFEQDVDRIARRARPSMVTVIAQRSVAHRPTQRGEAQTRTHNRVGSGVAVGRNEVVTTASVVLGAQRVFVLTGNNLQVEATIAGLDPVRNVALLRVQDLELPVVPLAQRPAESGDWVVALGHSYGASPTQSVGTVAMRYREPRTSLLQLTNEVYPGNSGAAAINSRGELVGLVQGELGAPEAPGRREPGERRPGGMSFAIPVEDVVPFLDGLRHYGRVRLGMLGVSTRSAFVDGDASPGDRIPIGALVEAVQRGGAAERLGLRKGDLVVAFDGERVEYSEQLARWVAATPPGTSVQLVWVRDEYRQEGRVALAESPSPIPSWMKVEPTPVAAAAGASPRVADIEAQIQRLSRQLDRLKSSSDTTR